MNTNNLKPEGGHPDSPNSSESGYASTAVAGIAWQGLVGLLIRVLRALVFLALARLLVPQEFGLVALASVFTAILMNLTGGGLSQALVRQPTLTKSHLDTAFCINIGMGFMLTCALAAASGVVSSWLEEPSLRPVLIGLSVMPLLAGISSVPEGLLSRGMKFRALSVRHLIATGASTIVALSLALAGAGVWALVVQTVLEAVLSCTALWLTARQSYRPGIHFSMQAYRELSSYGIKVVGSDLTMMISTRADDFLIGSALGSRALGVYSVAYRLLALLQDTLHGVVASVAFPLYARLQDEHARLAQGFLRASRLSLAIAGPIFVFVAGSASLIVPITLGERWLAAAPVMTALALSGVATIVTDANNTLLQARGHAGKVLLFSLLSAFANLTGFLLAVEHGVLWVAVAFTVRAYVLLPVSFGMVAHQVGGWRALARAYVPVVAALAIPGAAGLSVRFIETVVPALIAVIGSGIAATGCYLLLLRFISPECFSDLTMVGMRLLRVRRGIKREAEVSGT